MPAGIGSSLSSEDRMLLSHRVAPSPTKSRELGAPPGRLCLLNATVSESSCSRPPSPGRVRPHPESHPGDCQTFIPTRPPGPCSPSDQTSISAGSPQHYSNWPQCFIQTSFSSSRVILNSPRSAHIRLMAEWTQLPSTSAPLLHPSRPPVSSGCCITAWDPKPPS